LKRNLEIYVARTPKIRITNDNIGKIFLNIKATDINIILFYENERWSENM
tara:strand:- start:682 stop:831 length:150 start_codon:yes stop_codon:yes gene_type:complete